MQRSRIKLFIVPEIVNKNILKKMGFILDFSDPDGTLYVFKYKNSEVTYDLNKHYFVSKGESKYFVDLAAINGLIISEI